MQNNIEGIFTLSGNREPRLWEVPFQKSHESYKIPRNWIKQFGLVNGARLNCQIKGNRIIFLNSICGKKPTEFRSRSRFDKLIASNPTERFDFSSSRFPALKMIDKFAPIGKGSRALIVSPPKAGKTTLLENLAMELTENHSNVRVITLLIDERPEEVTSFQMQTKTHVYHSSMDSNPESHIKLTHLILDHLRLEVECGNDIVVLLDSLTRMGRAYNLSDRSSNGRTMSGGLGTRALEIPRKLFGLARNIEGGGSCTILATILTDTGSRMDEMIFQEFKGTGNCDIILDRELAEQRVFPAFNVKESGTRKDHLLLSMEELDVANNLRREILRMNKSAAIEWLKSIEK